MSRFRLPPWSAAFASLALLVSATLACALPFQRQPAQPGVSSPAATPQAAPGEPIQVPAGVLTEVAATLFAPYQATWTAQAVMQAAPPPVETQAAPPAAPTQALPPSPTQAQPTASPASPTAPPPTAQPPTSVAPVGTPTAVLLPTAYQPTWPPASLAIQSGGAFTVFGLNLHDCGGTYAANFLIQNTGAQALESLSLHFIDLNSDRDLYGPSISNTPFAWTDRTCSPGGIDQLDPGYWLFVGGLLGPGRLSGHSILANFLFCTAENLGGRCYPRSVEFVVP